MIKLKKIIVFFFVLLVFKAESQEIFQKILFTPDGGSGNSIVQTNDGGFLIAGQVRELITGQYDLNGLLIKTDSLGNIEWNKTIGNSNRLDFFRKIIKTQDGNYVVLGSTGSCGPIGIDYSINFNGDTLPNNISILKIDSLGAVLWSYCYGDTLNDYGNDIIEDINGDFIIIGTINETIPLYDNEGDVVLIRLDKNGILKWSKKIASLSGFLDFGDNICKGPDGGFYVSGGIVDYEGPSINSSYILLTDSNGSVLWSKMIEDTIGVYASNKMTDDNNGGAVFAFDGFTTSGTSGSPDIFILNFDSLGMVIWSKKYGTALNGNSISAISKSDNYIWAADNTILLKIDLLTGNLQNISFNFTPGFSGGILSINNKKDGGIILSEGSGISEILQASVDSLNHSCVTSSYVYPFQNFNVPVANYSFLDTLFSLQIDSVYIENSISIVDTTYCLTATGIYSVLPSVNFIVLPNPFTKEIQIQSPNWKSEQSVKIYDISGRLMYQNTGAENIFDLSFLLKGLYILKVEDEYQSWNFKIFKN